MCATSTARVVVTLFICETVKHGPGPFSTVIVRGKWTPVHFSRWGSIFDSGKWTGGPFTTGVHLQSHTGITVRSRIVWECHFADGGRPINKETRGYETARKWEKGRPQLRREECVKRDVRKAEQHDKWREKAVDWENWKCITTGKTHLQTISCHQLHGNALTFYLKNLVDTKIFIIFLMCLPDECKNHS